MFRPKMFVRSFCTFWTEQIIKNAIKKTDFPENPEKTVFPYISYINPSLLSSEDGGYVFDTSRYWEGDGLMVLGSW